MKRFIIALALVSFAFGMCWCGFAYASDAYLSKNAPVDKKPSVSIPSLAAEQPADMETDVEDYCTSTYTNTTDDWITYVEFNTIANQSGQEGADSYGDYTGIETTVDPGATYTLTVTVYSEGLWTEHVRAWIDWSQDEVFTSDESYYLGSGIDPTLSIDITVPNDAPMGSARLRVIEQWSSDPGDDGACDGQGNHSTTYGETEDYTVIVGEEGPCDVECPPGGIQEGEPDCGDEYVDSYNGGCNSEPSVFQAINAGEVICGTSGTFLFGGSNYRDTDWFTFTPDSDLPLTFTAEAEFNLLIFVIDAGTGNCEDFEIVSNITGEPCEVISLTHVPVPGQEYWYWVGPSEFTGWDCPLEYVATLTQEEPPPGGEDCENPEVVDALPYNSTGNSCTYLDDCDITGSDNSDIIYELVVDETISLVASLIGSDYDTKIAVYMTDCCSGEGNEFLYNDDFDGLQSQVEGVFQPGTYYVVVDGYGTACGNYVLNIYETEPPPPPPCESAVYGPNDDWTFATSDVEVGPYIVYDDFSCPDLESVNAIRYWGLDLQYNMGWYECSEDPTQMEIIFYEDAAGQPGNMICSYMVEPQVTYTGIYYASSYELVEYYATFESCDVNSGWVSIQGALNTGNSCVFLWGGSPDGNGVAWQDQNGSMVELDYDLAKEVLGTQVGIDETELLPARIDMLANYPNPFNATTTISFSLKNSGNVSIDIYDVLGRRVDRLDMGHLDNTQIHSVTYDAGQLATGVYFYSLMVDGEKKVTERFSLLK